MIRSGGVPQMCLALVDLDVKSVASVEPGYLTPNFEYVSI